MQDFREIIDKAKRASRRQEVPPPPGARVSPQHPGQAPEQQDVPTQKLSGTPLPGIDVPRPLTEAGTAAGALGLMEPRHADLEVIDFEMGNVPAEENRGAFPWQQIPLRPTSDFRFDRGMVELAPGETTPVLPSGE